MKPQTIAWIDRQKPDLVLWAERFVKHSKLYERKQQFKGSRAKVSRTQLRNVLNAAISGASIPELLNFLRYQVSRKSNPWQHEDSAKALAELLKGEIEDLSSRGAAQLDCTREEKYALQASLVAQLMGFVIREYTFQCKVAGAKP